MGLACRRGPGDGDRARVTVFRFTLAEEDQKRAERRVGPADAPLVDDDGELVEEDFDYTIVEPIDDTTSTS